MKNLLIGVLIIALINGVYFYAMPKKEMEELEGKIGAFYSQDISNFYRLFAEISRVDWLTANLHENELDLYISNLQNNDSPLWDLSYEGELIYQEINQIKDWMTILRDGGSLTVEEKEALTNNAYHLYLMMEDLNIEIKDNRQLYKGMSEGDKLMKEIVMENMKSIIQLK